MKLRRYPQQRALWDPLESVRPGALVAKRLDQRHEILRALGVVLRVGHQVFYRHRRFEEYARRKPHLMPSRLHLVCPLLHLDFILQQPAGAVLMIQPPPKAGGNPGRARIVFSRLGRADYTRNQQ